MGPFSSSASLIPSFTFAATLATAGCLTSCAEPPLTDANRQEIDAYAAPFAKNDFMGACQAYPERVSEILSTGSSSLGVRLTAAAHERQLFIAAYKKVFGPYDAFPAGTPLETIRNHAMIRLTVAEVDKLTRAREKERTHFWLTASLVCIGSLSAVFAMKALLGKYAKDRPTHSDWFWWGVLSMIGTATGTALILAYRYTYDQAPLKAFGTPSHFICEDAAAKYTPTVVLPEW